MLKSLILIYNAVPFADLLFGEGLAAAIASQPETPPTSKKVDVQVVEPDGAVHECSVVQYQSNTEVPHYLTCLETLFEKQGIVAGDVIYFTPDGPRKVRSNSFPPL